MPKSIISSFTLLFKFDFFIEYTCRFVFPEGLSVKLTTENEFNGHTNEHFLQNMA